MLFEVVKEFTDPGIKPRPASAGAVRQCQVVGQVPDLADFGFVVVMIRAHCRNRRIQPRRRVANGGEQDQFLFLHVNFQVTDHPVQ